MILRTIISLALSAYLFLSPALAQNKKASFDGQAAFTYTKILADDAMLGRRSGEPGGRMAAEYIASKLKEWGLEPAGDRGSFFQDFTFEYHSVARDASLAVFAAEKKRDFVYGEDWRQQRYSGSAQVSADIVFVGYGISAPQKGYDDYSGMDVKGKLALFSTDSPRRLAEKLTDEAQFQNRVKAAQDHGACGVLTFRSVTQATGVGAFRARLPKDMYRPDFAIISLESKIVDFIFKHLLTDPRTAFREVETTGKPQSLDTGVRCSVNLKVTFDEKRPAQNVLAKISGADRSLKNEYVIVGGHYDHLGIDPTGDVFNGADDNASGTAVVMEVARTMKLNQAKPKRTVIFALWGAEEEGLLGSKHYTENPLCPLEKTVAYINLDMEGEGTGRISYSGVYYAPEIWDILKPRLPKEILDNVDTGRGGPGGSDHTYFLSQGVPAYSVFTQGPHFRTNRVGDVIEMIKPEILKKSGDFVEAAVGILADAPQIPILAQRRENYYWKYLTMVNYETPPLDKAIQAHKDVVDPEVDFQLAVVSEKDGLIGDALKLEILKTVFDGQAKIRDSKGLVMYGAAGQAMTRGRMFGGRGPAKTTVLLGLRGIASFQNDLRWVDVYSKQGIAFIYLDRPGFLFGEKGLNDEGKKVVEAIGDANLLLVAKGLDPAQVRALLENIKKPAFLVGSSLPGKDVLARIKKTNSAFGLILGKDEDAAAYFRILDEAKKSVGTDNLSIVTENCLWSEAGKVQMIKLIGEMLKAKYENEDLASLFSGAFMNALGSARAADTTRAAVFMMF
jgi:hypothetical protein